MSDKVELFARPKGKVYWRHASPGNAGASFQEQFFSVLCASVSYTVMRSKSSPGRDEVIFHTFPLADQVAAAVTSSQLPNCLSIKFQLTNHQLNIRMKEDPASKPAWGW